MGLVEREEVLAKLESVAGRLRPRAGGRLVLLPGEAGAGKTSVVHAFVRGLTSDVAVVFGACDSARTASPLGPLRDWAAGGHGGELRAAIAGGRPREEVFDAALALLATGPCVAVVEDVHWADEATLDVIMYLGRRVDRTGAALLLTYRADEVGPGHPLSTVLGVLSSADPVRCPIPLLSRHAVAALVGDRPLDATELHARTGGNAFFVTECLSAGDEGVPLTVRDAVLARAAALGPDGRTALDAVAVVPGRAELWLAAALGASGSAVDECVEAGVLVAEGDAVRFRHELARAAVEGALPPHRRRSLHHHAVAALLVPPAGDVDHARLTHHAVAAGDLDAVLAHAPLAAAAASRAGARREAVALLQTAADRAGRLPPRERLAVWSRLAEERSLFGDHGGAVADFQTAMNIAAALDDDLARGSLLVRMSTPLAMSGDMQRANEAIADALSLLEGRVRNSALAMAYAQRCASHMLARQLADAEPWGAKAIDLATALRDDEVLAYVLIQSGVARWMAGYADGLERVRRGIDIARSRGITQLVAHGLSQIGSGGGEVRHYSEAVNALDECVAFADAHELGSRGLYAQAWLARCHFELGRWQEASTSLAAVLRSPRCDGITRMTALTAMGRLRARRGDPGVWAALDEALTEARRTGHLQRLWPVAAARAEAAWLEDRLDSEADLIGETYRLATSLRYPWAVSELALWLHRAGIDVGVESTAASLPFGLHVAGDHTGAASAWAELGCPYERASALADSDDDMHQLTALALFTTLGAAPAVRRLVDRRRSEGRRVPRGPNAATKGNPANLTDRELDVLRLVAGGLTNAAIAERLHLSSKTVGHHISHVLTKLSARTRAEAVAAAAAAGVSYSV